MTELWLSKNRLKTLAGLALLIPSFAVPYFISDIFPFYFGTVGVFIACRILLGKSWPKVLKLKLTPQDLALSLALLLVTYFLAQWLLPLTVQYANMGLLFVEDEDKWFRFYQFFQVLNEEILLRSLLLLLLIALVKKKEIAILASAFVFSLAHLIFYWSASDPTVFLSPMVLLNLFIFSLICNGSFFVFDNLLYAIALHAGWNLIRFSGEIQNIQSGVFLQEADGFNVIEASFFVTGLLVFSLVLLAGIRLIKSRFLAPA